MLLLKVVKDLVNETQVYEVLVAEEKAQAVHETVMQKLIEAKAAGNISSASFVRKLIKKGEV